MRCRRTPRRASARCGTTRTASSATAATGSSSRWSRTARGTRGRSIWASNSPDGSFGEGGGLAGQERLDQLPVRALIVVEVVIGGVAVDVAGEEPLVQQLAPTERATGDV